MCKGNWAEYISLFPNHFKEWVFFVFLFLVSVLYKKECRLLSLPLLLHAFLIQCKKYRDQLSPKDKEALQDKLCASELFKGKKSLYPKRWVQSMKLHHPRSRGLDLPQNSANYNPGFMFFSLPQPFRGEYLGLKENPKYRKLQTTANDKLVMADYVKKVNRGDGKVGHLINLLWLPRNCSQNMPSFSHFAPVKGRVLLIVILEWANIVKPVCI